MPDTLLLLLRHAAHDRVDRVLCGRMQGVSLGPEGRAQAARLAARIADRGDGPAALYVSPQPRARETAGAIAERCRLPLLITPALDEIDFGPAWTGRSFAELDALPCWHRWNMARASAWPPGGESMPQVQRRVQDWMVSLPHRHAGGVVVAVSHADVIKAALAAVLGLSLDAHARFRIDPASLSAIALTADGGTVLSMNQATA